MMSVSMWIVLGLSTATLVLPEAAPVEVEEGAQTLWSGRMTGRHSAREVRWDGEALEVGAPDRAWQWRAEGVERVGAAGACQVEEGWIGIAAWDGARWEAIRLVEEQGRWLETRWPLASAPVSGWSQLSRRGGCWMGLLLADGTLAMVGPGAAHAELLRGSVAASAAPEELTRGLLNASVGGWAVYGGPDGAIHAREVDGAGIKRFETGALALPEVVVEPGAGRLWWMTRDGALWSWAPAGDEAPVRALAGQGAVSAGPVAWPGVGLVWGDLGGRIWRWDGEAASLLMSQGAALPWAPLVFDAFDEAGRAALWVADDGGAVLLRAEGGMVEGLRLELGARSATPPRIVGVDDVDGLPWLSLAQGGGVARRARFVRQLSARLEWADVRLGEEPTRLVEGVLVEVSHPETPETPEAPEPPPGRPVEVSRGGAAAQESCAVGGSGAIGGGLWWAGMALAELWRRRRREARR